MDSTNIIINASSRNELPEEYQKLYDVVRGKIESMIVSKVNIKFDPTTLRIIMESAMIAVEGFRGDDGNPMTGPEKRRIALTLVEMIIRDLSKAGKIDKASADEIITELNFWGGLVMDIAVAATNAAINMGKTFTEDASKNGCSAACKNCCVIM